jgi:hypothetical protein
VINKHERDDRIQFEEASHIYTVDGVRAGWTSCTGFLHNFFSHFDADADDIAAVFTVTRAEGDSLSTALLRSAIVRELARSCEERAGRGGGGDGRAGEGGVARGLAVEAAAAADDAM